MSETERPRRRRGWLVALVLAVAAGALALRVSAVREERARLRAQEAEEEAARQRKLAPTLRRLVTARRVEVIDGQCAGKGLPRYGWIYEGLTYEQNVRVGRDDGCFPFSDPNITNFFCCVGETRPTH